MNLSWMDVRWSENHPRHGSFSVAPLKLHHAELYSVCAILIGACARNKSLARRVIRDAVADRLQPHRTEQTSMSRTHCWTVVLATLALQSVATLADASSAFAHDAGINVDGRYHSVTNGIADYDGFDRFRNPRGQPLPGWQQMLSNKG